MTPNQYTFRYRVRNWSDYNRALIARGRLTFWFDEDAVAAWRNADPPKGPGAPKVYSDTAIQCALILKSVFQLSRTPGAAPAPIGLETFSPLLYLRSCRQDRQLRPSSALVQSLPEA